MKNLIKQSFRLLILLCATLSLQGMFTSSLRLKALKAMKARGGQLPSRTGQLGTQEINIESTSSFGPKGQKRAYASSPKSTFSSVWSALSNTGSYVYDVATGNLERRYNTPERLQLFEFMRGVRNKLERGKKLVSWSIYANDNIVSSDDIINTIKKDYSSAADVVWNGTSINSESFKILKFCVDDAIRKAGQTGFFDSNQIRIAFKLCQEIRKLAPQQGPEDKIIIQRTVTELFKYLVDRYKGSEELISFADFMEICVLIVYLSEVSNLQSFGPRDVLSFIPWSAMVTGLKAMNINPNMSMIDFARTVTSKLQNFKGKQKVGIKIFKKSVKKMFSNIRQRLISEEYQELLTRLENLMDLSEDELNVRSRQLPDEKRGKRTFYFQEEGPREQWEQEQRQEQKQQSRGGSFSFESEATIDSLKEKVLKVPLNTSNEMTLKLVTQYIKENHPDKFTEEIKEQKDKEFREFMGKYDKVIKNLKAEVRREQQNRE